MQVSLAEAPEFLAELAARVEAGEEVTLTRSGREVVRLVPIAETRPSREEFLAVVDEVRAYGRQHATPGPDAARSQDFLYDDDGLPG